MFRPGIRKTPARARGAWPLSPAGAPPGRARLPGPGRLKGGGPDATVAVHGGITPAQADEPGPPPGVSGGLAGTDSVTIVSMTDDDSGLYAGADDTPKQAQLRRSLVRLFATTPVFMDQPASEYPHLAADVAMRILVPALEMVTAEADATVRSAKAAVANAAEVTLAQRLAVVEAAARASERAACVKQLRTEAAHLAAMALEASGPDAEVAARGKMAMSQAARALASQPASA
jgi:hypothetical protein